MTRAELLARFREREREGVPVWLERAHLYVRDAAYRWMLSRLERSGADSFPSWPTAGALAVTVAYG